MDVANQVFLTSAARCFALCAAASWFAACNSEAGPSGSMGAGGAGGASAGSGGSIGSGGNARGGSAARGMSGSGSGGRGGATDSGAGGASAGTGGNAGSGGSVGAGGGGSGGASAGAGGAGAAGRGGTGGLGRGGASSGGSGGGGSGGRAGTGGGGGPGGGGGAGGTATGGNLGPAGPFSCTQMIGFSQTNGWYSAFEAKMTNAKWELRWANGAGVDVWQNPNYSGWTSALVSPCAQSSNDAVRVLFTVSGPGGTDVGQWESDIKATLATTRSKLPRANAFILQPVVGGPGNCSPTVRADNQNQYILQAIKNVAAQDSQVFVGYDAHVASCADFADTLGHLTSSAYASIGAKIGDFYAANLPDP